MPMIYRKKNKIFSGFMSALILVSVFQSVPTLYTFSAEIDQSTDLTTVSSGQEDALDGVTAEWIYTGVQTTAGGVCVIDADTLTVLYEKNRNEQFYPASITKIMTALVTLENCDMEETVTITSEALQLESGAVTAGLSVGDTLSVRDLLYAALLRSANDAAAALAIHVAGSIDGFASMMNQKATELGCQNTHFTNPHGLSDSAHLTTAYDMALIMAACVKNEDFLEIESHESYKLAGTANYPGGLTVTIGHRMLRSDTSYTDDRVIAGKTGYTVAAQNTLVTAASSGERTVVVVLLNGKNPDNYQDTETLIDFGLDSFINVTMEDALELFDSATRLANDHIAEGAATRLLVAADLVITVPIGYSQDALTVDYEYNLSQDAPELSVALMELNYAGRTVGTTYILDDRESDISVEEISETAVIPEVARTAGLLIIGGLAAIIIAFFTLSEIQTRRRRAERERLRALRRRRERRLMDMGVYPSDFRNSKRNQNFYNGGATRSLVYPKNRTGIYTQYEIRTDQSSYREGSYPRLTLAPAPDGSGGLTTEGSFRTHSRPDSPSSVRTRPAGERRKKTQGVITHGARNTVLNQDHAVRKAQDSSRRDTWKR